MGHVLQFKWVNGSRFTLLDPIPAVNCRNKVNVQGEKIKMPQYSKWSLGWVLISLSQAIESASGYTTESVTHGQCDARPTVTFPANGRYQFIPLGEQRHIVCEQLAQSRYMKRNFSLSTSLKTAFSMNYYILRLRGNALCKLTDTKFICQATCDNIGRLPARHSPILAGPPL